MNQVKSTSESYVINKMSTRPVSPFIAFCLARRSELQAANPNANYGEIGMVLTALWKSKTQSEKDAYAQPSSAPAPVPELRRSGRLRNKRLGLNFWGSKINK
jgi:hypothetical protein